MSHHSIPFQERPLQGDNQSCTFDEFLDLLETLLDGGIYLGEAVYLEAIRKGGQFAAEHE